MTALADIAAPAAIALMLALVLLGPFFDGDEA